jgi:hypothetical protein
MIACGLEALDASADAVPALSPLRASFDRHLTKARALAHKADARCAQAKRGPARKGLRLLRQRLGMVGKSLRTRPVRTAVPSEVLDPLLRAAAALADDVRRLATSLACD